MRKFYGLTIVAVKLPDHKLICWETYTYHCGQNIQINYFNYFIKGIHIC